MKLTVLIPVYNEEENVLKVLDMVIQSNIGNISKEIIVIDDCSTDGTREVLKNIDDKDIKIIFKNKNSGKGHSVREGIRHCSGDIIIIQDADLEYDPQDYFSLIEPIINNTASVVYGSRILKKSNKISDISFFLGGKLVTWATNILFFARLTDEPTCYKVFKADLIKSIRIDGNRFNWEPEITAKILKKGINIYEVPISYYPRTKSQGKKINWIDGIDAIWTLFKYRFRD